MPDAVVAAQSQVQPDQAELPVAQQVVLEAMKLSDRLNGLGQNGDPSEQAAITKQLHGALSLLRGEIVSTAPLSTLSPVAAQFETAYAGKFSTLEVQPGVHGKREVRFTLRGGLDNLEAACDEINEAMKGARNYPREGFKVYLSGNNDLPKGQDIVVTWTPVIRDSGNRVRFGTDPDTSHQGLLKSLGLGEVNNDLHCLACGALRVKEGFPKDSNEIGTTNDQGDLNEGKVVRTAKGARSGAVASSHNGGGGRGWGDGGADGDFVVAGASPRN